MAKKLFKRKQNTFQVSVGEEGAVVVYSQSGYAKAKIFVKSVEQSDTEKLRELLAQDRDAMIYIYIDTLDQSYVQRSLPAVSSMGVGKVAQKRLEKEVPKDHLKAAVQIGRSPIGRKDWIYTFISSGMEPPVSTWIEFFLPFHNVIAGIYFLPVELYSVVTKLKHLAQKENQFQAKDKKSGLSKLLSSFRGDNGSSAGRWEVYLSQNKTGGFRQVAFQDGKIVFSRLLNNINDPLPDIVAGNIEQEIANSIEYMSRLSLGTDQEVDVYLILSSEILRYLRKEKIKATNLFVYSPFELANRLKVTEAAAEKDKFADPTILTIFSKVPNKIITLHTAVTGKVFRATQMINFIGFFFVFLIPFFAILIVYNITSVTDLKSSIAQIKNQALNFQAQLNEQKKRLELTESRIKEPIKPDHILELVELWKFFNVQQRNPILEISKLSKMMPLYARAKVIKWNFTDQMLFNYNTVIDSTKRSDMLAKTREFSLDMGFEIVVKRTGSSYEELEQKYSSLTDDITKAFADYDISVSELPQSITFQDTNAPISVNVIVKLPAAKKGIVVKTPAAPQVHASTTPAPRANNPNSRSTSSEAQSSPESEANKSTQQQDGAINSGGIQ